MDATKTDQTRKLVAVSFSSNGRKIQAFVKGEVDPKTGKTRITANDYTRMTTALGVRRGNTITTG